MASLYPIDHCKQFLSAVIRSEGAVLAETALIEESDFDETHRPIFAAIKTCVATGPLNRFILISKLQSVGLKIGGEIDPALYINALVDLQGVSDKAAVGIAAEIKKWSIRREIDGLAAKITAITRDPKWGDKTAGDLVSEATGVFNERINLLEGSGAPEPKDLYGTIDEFISHENSFTGRSVEPPWRLFLDWYGTWDAGTAPHLIASRMKIGKSTLWLSMGLQLAQKDDDDSLRILVLDTELSVAENQSRSLSQVSGVNEFRIRSGKYRQKRDEKDAVEAAAALIKPLARRVSHHFCGAQSLESIASTIRRWAFKNLGPGKRGLVVYDYIKLMNNDFKSDSPMFIQMAGKMEMLKNLTKELNVPCLAFCQTNRENVETKGGSAGRSTAVIGGSDMLAQFASNVYLLEEMTPDDRAWLGQLGENGATHTLRDIACRQLGENQFRQAGLVAYQDDRERKCHSKNYLLFRFKSFNATEVCSFRDAIDRIKVAGIDVQGKPGAKPADGKML